jgi:hypothetical protein
MWEKKKTDQGISKITISGVCTVGLIADDAKSGLD